MIPQTKVKTARKEILLTGETLLTTTKKLIHEGNVRRVIIKQDGHIIVELPLTVGVIGVMLTPTLAAIGAISALLAACSIEVERIDPPVEVSKTEPQ